MCEALKQRWGMLAQGYFLVLLTSENEKGNCENTYCKVDETCECKNCEEAECTCNKE